MTRRKEKVTKVVDGDTFYTNRREKPIRLANANAPDKGERGHGNAKKFLERQILGKEVGIDTVAVDKYGRYIANVYDGRRSVNKKVKKKFG